MERINVRLSIVLFASALVPLLLFASYMYYFQNKIIRQELIAKHKITTQNFMLSVEHFAKQNEILAATISSYFLKPKINSFDLEIIANKYLEDFPHLEFIKIIKLDGEEFISAERNRHTPLDREIFSYFSSAISETYLLTKFFYDEYGIPCLYRGHKIYRQDKLSYILIIKVAITELWLVLDKQIPAEKGNSILVSQDQHYLAHSKEELKTLVLQRSKFQNFELQSSNEDQVHVYTNTEGKKVAALSTWIESLQCILINEWYYNQLFAPRQKITHILLISLLIVILLIFFFGYFAGNILIIRPIRQKERYYLASFFHHALIHDIKKKLLTMSYIIKQLTVKEKQELENEISSLCTFFDKFKYFSDQIQLNKITVNLKFLVEDIVKKILPEASSKNITIKLEGEDDIELVLDSFYFTRAIHNILTNSIEALSSSECENKLIQIDLNKQYLKISNNGPLLKNTKLKQVYDPFFTHGKNSGSGLGLAITKNIINAHGFKIKMENYASKVSTTIRF